MDLLQLALIFLIALLTVFLTITGVQVFLILRDLKNSLDKLNNILFAEEAKEKLATFAKRSARAQQTSKRLFKKLK